MQAVFWCQQNLCQWGKTCGMVGRGATGTSRKGGERAKHWLWFCASPPGVGSWHTWQQDWTKTRRGTENRQTFLPSKDSFSLSETSSPLRLQPDCQLLKAIALLHYIDCSWGLLWMLFSDFRAFLSALFVSVGQTMLSSSILNVVMSRCKIRWS